MLWAWFWLQWESIHHIKLQLFTYKHVNVMSLGVKLHMYAYNASEHGLLFLLAHDHDYCMLCWWCVCACPVHTLSCTPHPATIKTFPSQREHIMVWHAPQNCAGFLKPVCVCVCVIKENVYNYVISGESHSRQGQDENILYMGLQWSKDHFTHNSPVHMYVHMCCVVWWRPSWVSSHCMHYC